MLDVISVTVFGRFLKDGQCDVYCNYVDLLFFAKNKFVEGRARLRECTIGAEKKAEVVEIIKNTSVTLMMLPRGCCGVSSDNAIDTLLKKWNCG